MNETTVCIKLNNLLEEADWRFLSLSQDDFLRLTCIKSSLEIRMGTKNV